MAKSDRQVNTPGKRVVIAVTHTAAGGVFELWQDLAAGLRARGHQVDLFAFYPEDEDAGLPLIQPGWIYILRRRPHTLLDGIRLLRGLWRYLRQARPAVMITAMPFAGIVLSLLGRFVAFVPIIVTHHSPSFTYAARLRWLEPRTRALDNVRAIVCVSPSVADSFRPPAGYEARLQTIRNALPREVERHLATLRAQRAGRTPGRRLVAIGRLAKQKNYPVLLRAMAHLDDVTLDIIGEGDDRADLMALVDTLGIGARVTFHGLLSRTDALRLAAGSDVFVQPSLYEGHSLALIEAACLGQDSAIDEMVARYDDLVLAALVPKGTARNRWPDTAQAAK